MDSRDLSARRWRWVIIGFAVLLPAFTYLLLLVPSAAFESWAELERRPVEYDWKWADLPAYFGLVVFNWPIVVYAFFASKRMKNPKRSLRAVRAATVWGLIGILVPYALMTFYVAVDLRSGAPDAGQGTGIFYFFVLPVIGGLFGRIGWGLGMVLFGSSPEVEPQHGEGRGNVKGLRPW